ncbi:helix-turn-helix domain-containing protein [Streptomyces iakyrus]|uniref:helix-turn-helix domain-containing protein n=1 Tax=Streptomyces iakyrus TaxID=68219 RepID=UPI0036C46268
MPKQEERSLPKDWHPVVLTVNQVVSYNLGRARRSRGWTQEETAEKLEGESGKKWTAATLSASERAVKTGRPRVFDANELITFSRVFEYPVAYFFLPVVPSGNGDVDMFFYALSRLGEEDGQQVEPLLGMQDLLYSVIPLRYPAAVVDEVNRLLQSRKIVWQPDARVEWQEGYDGDYETERFLQNQYTDDPVTLDEWKVIEKFAALSKRMPPTKILRLLADAMQEPPRAAEGEGGDPPF